MASEKRRLPNSNLNRRTALNNAKEMNDLLGLSSFLCLETKAKLNYIQPLYNIAMQNIAKTSSAEMKATSDLSINREKLRRLCSRFVQVFKLAVEDKEFPVADFAYYKLDSKGNVPVMDTDAEISAVAHNLIFGENARVTSGGEPMAMPALAKVIKLTNLFELNCRTQNRAISAMLDAKRAVQLLNPKAKDAILFVWNEVETRFSNLKFAAIRVQGRLWGIVYVKQGSTKKITGTITDNETGEIIIGATIYFESGNNDDESDANGFKFNTSLMDIQKLVCEHPLYMPWHEEIKLVENENLKVDIRMIKIITSTHSDN
jgi:hypothetical protein